MPCYGEKSLLLPNISLSKVHRASGTLFHALIILTGELSMQQSQTVFAICDDAKMHSAVLRVIKFLALIARPPQGGYPQETEWLRRTHTGPHTSEADIAAVTGVDPSAVKAAMEALDAADFLSVAETGGEASYALKRAWSRLLLDVEKHGWTREGKTLRDAVMAGDGWASTTNFWGNWELHSDGYITTRELRGGIDQQASRATEKGLAALKVLQVLYPIGNVLKTAA